MDILAENIKIGSRAPQPIRDVLVEMADPELPESEFWRRMSYLLNYAAQTGDGNLLRQLDNIKKGRFGKPFPPALVTTPQNLPARGKQPDEKLNVNAPRINLQRLLEQPWFAANCSDKVKYGKEWIGLFVRELMAGERGLYLAREWKKRPVVIKGQVVGALLKAGVLKGSNLAISRTIHGEEKNTKEVSTFANYMGRLDDEPYVEFVMKYVKEEK